MRDSRKHRVERAISQYTDPNLPAGAFCCGRAGLSGFVRLVSCRGLFRTRCGTYPVQEKQLEITG